MVRAGSGNLNTWDKWSFCLRVRPESFLAVAKLSEHEADRGEAQENQRAEVQVFPILGQPAATIEPGDCSFDDPSYRQQHKSLRVIRTFDDFNFNMRERFRQRAGELRPLISGVGDEFLQERKHAEQSRHHENAAVAILDVGGVNDGVKQQALRVYKQMALLALDFLARVIAMRIDAGPPFSALLTLWLSMMQAVGLASRSSFSRHATYSA